jgi:NAD(P)H-hydrate epimerase
MEIAGWQVARWLFTVVGGRAARILVVAGHGNNGGDGLVAARHLLTWGFPVEIALVADPDRLGELVAIHLGAVRALGAAVATTPGGHVASGALDSAEIVVDAILGTGVRGDPRPPQAEAIARLPADRTVAIDVPSGLDATTGTPGTPTVHAVRTCTLTAMKAGLWAPAGRRHAGEITVADIGMPTTAWAAAGLTPPTLIRGGELLTIPTDTGHVGGTDATA